MQELTSLYGKQGALVQHSPLTRRVYAFTVCGDAFRLWTADCNSFASSRISDFRNLQHRTQLIETLAFVLYPGNDKEERWFPPLKFDVESGHTGMKTTIQAGPAEMLNVRGDLFGSRTTVWASDKLVPDDQHLREDAPSSFEADGADCPFRDGTNEVRLQDSLVRAASTELLQGSERFDPSKPPLPDGWDRIRLVTKATWIAAEVVHHEERMLHILHTAEAVALYPLATDVSSTESISRIAKPIGHTQDELISRWNTEGEEKSAPVRLSILVTQCPIGRNLPTIARNANKLSLRNWGQIFLGILECLWFSSSKGIHYRDLNLGNVMWAWMPDGKTVVAWLVDWGNARHLQQPRILSVMSIADVIRLAEDDGRSANPYFRSTACNQASQLSDEYLRQQGEYSSYLELIRNKEANPDVVADLASLKDETAIVQEEMQKTIMKARQASHRYVDDLESLIYLMYYVVSRS